MWTNPLDRVPQIRVEYANHIIYGEALGIVLYLFGLTLPLAALAVLWVAGIKKTVDYFKEAESLSMCLAKTVVTAAIPILLAVIF